MEEKNPMNILLVEDNPADARLVEIYLSESTMIDPTIVKTTELGKGLLMLEEQDFDVVLLDLTLPDSSGFSTIKTMLDEFPEQTVIVMTGLEDETVALNSVKAGAQDFIVKGQFDSNLLSRTITYAIERHQLQRRLEDYAKAIKLNEQRLLEAQKMARIGNWEMDIVNNSMFWSEEVFRILGVKENSIEPTLNDFMKQVVSEDRDALKTSINRAMEKGKSFMVEYSIEQKDGSSKRLACQGQVQMSKKSSGLCLVGTIQDISSFANRSSAAMPTTAIKTKLEDSIAKLQDGGAIPEALTLLREAVQMLEQG